VALVVPYLVFAIGSGTFQPGFAAALLLTIVGIVALLELVRAHVGPSARKSLRFLFSSREARRLQTLRARKGSTFSKHFLRKLDFATSDYTVRTRFCTITIQRKHLYLEDKRTNDYAALINAG